MPDWSYQTIFKPLLFQLSPEDSRNITLKSMNKLATIPFGIGGKIIEFMGHMTPSISLRRDLLGSSISSPIGLSGRLDPELIGTEALSNLGFGYIELGPVTLQSESTYDGMTRDRKKESIKYSSMYENIGLSKSLSRLNNMQPLKTPFGVRISHAKDVSIEEAITELSALVNSLSSFAAYFVIDLRENLRNEFYASLNEINKFKEILSQTNSPILLPVDPQMSTHTLISLINNAIHVGIQGFIVDEAVSLGDGKYKVDKEVKDTNIEMVKFLHANTPPNFKIIASGGIYEPIDALEFLYAGADFLQIQSGLVFSGPGLPKRINEAIVYDNQNQNHDDQPIQNEYPKNQIHSSKNVSWVGFSLFSLGILLGGIIALYLGLTQVVLSYDEQFLGMSKEQLTLLFSERLIFFMAHDRITLAGTMISSSILYGGLSFYLIKNGVHWARKAIITAGMFGFLSFFLFLGYGYFDKLHALFWLILLPFYLLGLKDKNKITNVDACSNLTNSRAWKKNQWGQLLFISLSVAFIIAGISISMIGMTSVFVKEDLKYLCLPPELLNQVNDKIIPLIAHDRAGFGGALLTEGILLLMISLWGFKQGAKWLWVMLLIAGIPGFTLAIGTHFMIGYVDVVHLTPAFVALIMYVGGLYFTYSYLILNKGEHIE
ncbi:dihydroorotate dehydrogenase [Chengkuizengella sediminis]|uniref:dihydroorotate dehydrogenase n=1 Tax=Chengkuizengella sediminis TaxID=1885917 RepID=UPI0013896981|nr:dihydroorotate dehydrogenase [Chengkuizengella sediminis]NDI34103.1 dihydroorotate dehydrogenase [Chengkuizengella sediminis]